MATSFPGALDTLSNPAASDKTNNLVTPHAAQHINANDAIEAIEAKLGTGASTAILNAVLTGSGVGASAWSNPSHSALTVPRALFHLTANQSLTSGAEPAISWLLAGQDANTGPMWAAGNPTRFTVPSGQDGLYIIVGQVVFAASAAGSRRVAEIYFNGSGYLNYYVDAPSRGASFDTQVQIIRPAQLTAGQYIELRALQDSGGALNAVSTSNGTFLGMIRVG